MHLFTKYHPTENTPAILWRHIDFPRWRP